MIEIQDLAKAFALSKNNKLSDTEKQDVRYSKDAFHSVRNVSFSCGSGEVLGLLGPNGAGKTTTLRMLSTALKPDAGSVLLNGVDVLKQPVKARQQIGFLSADTGLYGKLTAYENIAYFGRLHGMSEKALKQRRHQPMLLVDIAVPRDIEPEVADLDDAFLYTVDDLHSIIEQNKASRKEAAEQAELITEEQSHLFMEWVRSLESVDSIREYRSQSMAIKDELVERALNKLAQGGDTEQVLIELANRLTNRLIHAPTQALTVASRQGDLNTLGQLRTALGLDKN